MALSPDESANLRVSSGKPVVFPDKPAKFPSLSGERAIFPDRKTVSEKDPTPVQGTCQPVTPGNMHSVSYVAHQAEQPDDSPTLYSVSVQLYVLEGRLTEVTGWEKKNDTPLDEVVSR